MARLSTIVNFARSYLTPAGKRAAWNLSWMLVGRVVGHTCSLAVVLLLTHALSQEQFGMITTALAVQGYILLLGGAGMPAVVVREAVQRPEDFSLIGATYLVVSWTIGGISAAMAILAVMLMPISVPEKSLLAFMFLGAAVAAGNPECLYDALHNQAVPALLFAVSDAGFFIAVILIIWAGRMTLPMLGVLFLAKWMLSIGALVLFLRGQKRFLFRDAGLKEAARLWRSSWPLLVAGFLAMIPVSGGTIIVRLIHGAEEAGIMGLAVQVVQAFLMLTVLAHRLVYPHVAGPFRFSRRFILQLTLFYLAYSGGLFVASSCGSYVVVRYVLPSAYAAALWPAIIMGAAGLIATAATVFHNYLLVLRREHCILMGYAGAALGFVIASALLRRFGATGQAPACLAAYYSLLLVNIAVIIRLPCARQSMPTPKAMD